MIASNKFPSNLCELHLAALLGCRKLLDSAVALYKQRSWLILSDMEDSITFSQELPSLVQKRSINTENTPLVESAREIDATAESSEQVRRPIKPLVYGIVATSALGSFLWGYNLSVIAGAMLIISDHFSLNVQWHGFVVSVMIAGAAVGALTAGVLNDKLGRWMVMLFSAILFGVGAIVMALAVNKVYLVVGRAIVGVGTGE